MSQKTSNNIKILSDEGILIVVGNDEGCAWCGTEVVGSTSPTALILK